MASSRSLGTPKNWDGKPLQLVTGQSHAEISGKGKQSGLIGRMKNIKVIDLGESFLQGTEPVSRHLLRVLESFDHRADLWSAG
jgi:hypothetical protein